PSCSSRARSPSATTSPRCRGVGQGRVAELRVVASLSAVVHNLLAVPFLTVRERRCPQAVIATASANACDGGIHPMVCRGRVLSERAIASSSRCVRCERSDDLGRYWRSSPLVFSLLPRCHGLFRVAEARGGALSRPSARWRREVRCRDANMLADLVRTNRQ